MKKMMLGALVAAASVCLLAGTARGGGLLVPTKPEIPVQGAWDLKSHTVDIRVRDGVATVRSEQLFMNITDGPLEVQFVLPAPADGNWESVAIAIDGKEVAQTMSRGADADKTLEQVARAKRDGSLLEYYGSTLYATNPFLMETAHTVRVVSTYKAPCRPMQSLTEIDYGLSVGKFSDKVVENIDLRLDIADSARAIDMVYSPTHAIRWYYKLDEANHVSARWSAANVRPTSDLQVFCGSSGNEVDAGWLTYQPDPHQDGYFLLLTTPTFRAIPKAAPKDVVILLDHSGLMGGVKLDEAKVAVEYILRNLNPEDRFSLMTYNEEVESPWQTLMWASRSKAQEALEWLAKIESHGAANWQWAVTGAFERFVDANSAAPKPKTQPSTMPIVRRPMFQGPRPAAVARVTATTLPTSRPTAAHKPSSPLSWLCCCCCCPPPATKPAPKPVIPPARAYRAPYVFWITGGVPSSGRTDEHEIAVRATVANRAKARLFAFAVGKDVNARLIDRLVREFNGDSVYLQARDRVDLAVKQRYDQINWPVVMNPSLYIRPIDITRLYPPDLGNLGAAKMPAVQSGRFSWRDANAVRNDDPNAVATILLKGYFAGRENTFEYPARVMPVGTDRRLEFIERLWALRRLGWVADQVQVRLKSPQVADEFVRISRAYGFITPYTLFLVDPNISLNDVDEMRELVQLTGEALWPPAGPAGQLAAVNREVLNHSRLLAPTTKPWEAVTQPSLALEKANLAGNETLHEPNLEPPNTAVVLGHTSRTNYLTQNPDLAGGIRLAGNEAIYRRGSTWIASSAADVDLIRDADRIKTVGAFSDEYFQLVRENTPSQNLVLSTQKPGEALVVMLRGQAYRIR